MRAVGRSEHFERNQCRWVALSPVPAIEKIYVCSYVELFSKMMPPPTVGQDADILIW